MITALKKNKKILVFVNLVSAIVFAGVLIAMQMELVSNQAIEEYRFLPVVVPAFLFTATFLPVMYLNWFETNEQKSTKIRKVLFGFFAINFVLIWLIFIGAFIL